MTKADIVEEIATRTGLTRTDAADIVENFLSVVKDCLRQGMHIEIRGFGTFKVVERKPRIARNPRTGEEVPLGGRKVPVLKISRELKNRIAGL
ncbi:MAG: HU family DNA-binding protein [bacterium]